MYRTETGVPQPLPLDKNLWTVKGRGATNKKIRRKMEIEKKATKAMEELSPTG